MEAHHFDRQMVGCKLTSRDRKDQTLTIKEQNPRLAGASDVCCLHTSPCLSPFKNQEPKYDDKI